MQHQQQTVQTLFPVISTAEIIQNLQQSLNGSTNRKTSITEKSQRRRKEETIKLISLMLRTQRRIVANARMNQEVSVELHENHVLD
jgi:hypothetical protein